MLSKFKKFLIIYSAILIVGVIFVLIWLNGLLRDYEAGSPIIAMDRVMEDLRKDKLSVIQRADLKNSEFENAGRIARKLTQIIGDKEIYYRKKGGEYSETHPVYEIFSDKKPIAKVTLQENGRNGHGFTEWQFGTIEVWDYLEKQTVDLTVPFGSQVKINGVEAGQGNIAVEKQDVWLCKNVLDYTQQPYNTVYHIEDVLADPELTVSYNGTELGVVQEDGHYVAYFPEDKELLNDQRDYIINIMENYARYMINRGNLGVLRSFMVGKASEYMSDIKYIHVYLLGQSFNYSIKNQNVTNFRKYSEDCFSCDVACDLYVEYYAGNYNGSGDTTYNINLTYVFAKVNGQWKLADFTIN